MPLPFNKDLDLKLIKLVQEYPILYNHKHAKYLDFDAREVVWQKIGDTLGRPALVCKTRWVNIRDMMRRKIRDRLRNSNHSRYNYKYEDELSFMLPYYKEVSTTTATEEYEFGEEDISSCEVDMPAQVFINENQEFERLERDVKPDISNAKARRDDAPVRDTSVNEARENGQELNPADPLDVFLLTIGVTLRKFSPYFLNQAKSKIFQVVQDYELQQIVEKDTSLSSDNTNR